jgi:hypothetical protein
MATVSVVFGKWHGKKPVITVRNQSEVITSSGASQTSSNTGTVGDDCVEVATSGGAVWVTIDGTTAAAGTGFLLPDGTTRHFDAGFGTVVKVIDA